jgi:hypothetical protein
LQRLLIPLSIVVAGALVALAILLRPAAVTQPGPPSSTESGSGTREEPRVPAPETAALRPTEATVARERSGEAPVSPELSDEPPVSQPSLPSEPHVAASRTDEQVAEEVRRRLEEARPQLVERCWNPSVRAQPEPPEARFVLNFTFGADGGQITRGLAEVRGTSRPELTACLSDALPEIAVEPPGRNTYVEVPLTLP